MDIRDAVEDDAEKLAGLAESPQDVLKNMVHDRTVRVAVKNNEIIAFVSFDAIPGTVHITQLVGNTDGCERLLEEPIRFAENENMRVEILIPATASTIKQTVRDAGFTPIEPGSHFNDTPLDRYEYTD